MPAEEKRMLLFSGTANPELAEDIARHLGVELGNVKIREFANGEIYVRYLESVRGADASRCSRPSQASSIRSSACSNSAVPP